MTLLKGTPHSPQTDEDGDDPRFSAIRQRRRPGLLTLLWADLKAEVYQTRWQPLSSFAAWQQPFVVVATLGRLDALWAVAAYRLKRFLRRWHVPFLPRLADAWARAVYQVEIGDHVYIGPGLYLPHGLIVLDGIIEIGANCVISPWVTLGLRRSRAGFSFHGPTLGDGVWIGTHAMLLGDIQVGNHVTIGAGSLVIHDLEDYTTAAGSPARIVHHATEAEIALKDRVHEIQFRGG